MNQTVNCPPLEDSATRTSVPSVFAAGFTPLFIGLLLYVLNANLFALVPYYLALRGSTEVVYGIAAGMLNLGGVAAMVLYGNRADSTGRRRWVLQTLLVAGLGNGLALLAMQGSAAWYVAATTCHGVMMGLGLPAIFVWASELGHPTRRTEMFAFLGIAGLLGDALGPALGEALLLTQPQPNTPAAFYVVFVAANVLWPLTIVAFVCVPNVAGPAEGQPRAGWGPLLRQPELRLSLLATVAFGGALGTMLSLGKNFVASIGLDFVAILLGGHAAGAIVVRIALPWILHRFDRVKLVPFAFGGIAASLGLLAITRGYGMLLAAGLLYGVSHGLLFPSLLSRLIDYGGSNAAGRLSTLFMGMFGLGAGLWPLAGGIMLERAGFPLLFCALAVANVAAIMLYRRSELHYGRRSEQETLPAGRSIAP